MKKHIKSGQGRPIGKKKGTAAKRNGRNVSQGEKTLGHTHTQGKREC